MNNAPAETAPTLPSRKIEEPKEPEIEGDTPVENLIDGPPQEEPKTLTSAFDDFDLLAAAPRKLFE